MKKIIYLTGALLFACTITYSQTDTLTNKSVVDLGKAKLSKELIMTMIKNTPCNFKTDAQSILQLKKEGIPDEVLALMIEKSSGTNASYASKSESGVLAEVKKQGSGIYYLSNDGTITALEATVYAAAKANVYLPTVSGIFNAKENVILSGTTSRQQIKQRRPVFYFYFEPNNLKGLSNQIGWFTAASSPNEFILTIFETTKKGREVTISKKNNLNHNVGIDNKSKQEFQFKKIEAGLYEIYFDTDLKPGEYGFSYSSLSTTNAYSNPRVYDFSIR